MNCRPFAAAPAASTLILLFLSGTMSAAASCAAEIPLTRPLPRATRQEYTLLYLQKQALWRKRVVVAGTKVRGAIPERICKVHYDANKFWLCLAVSRDGKRAAIDSADSDGVYLVDVHPGATPRFLKGVAEPSFSPEGTQLAVSTVYSDAGPQQMPSVSILDIRKRRWRTLCTKASSPTWSQDGREIAMIGEESPTSEMSSVLVVDASTGAVKYRVPHETEAADPVISPNGRYVGWVNALSRPKLGHVFEDRQTEKALDRSFDYPDRLPAVLKDWSPDSQYALWDWRAPNPQNDGSWLWDEVGLTSIKPGLVRWIGVGWSPKFSLDGQWIGYLKPRRKERCYSPGALCLTPFSGGQTTAVAQNVSAFAFAR